MLRTIELIGYGSGANVHTPDVAGSTSNGKRLRRDSLTLGVDDETRANLELLEQTHLGAISAVGEVADFKSHGNRHTGSTREVNPSGSQSQPTAGEVWLELKVNTHPHGLADRMYQPTPFDVSDSRVAIKRAVQTPSGVVAETVLTLGSDSEFYRPFLRDADGKEIPPSDKRFVSSVKEADRLVTKHVNDLRRRKSAKPL